VSAPALGARIPIRFEPIAGESFDGWLEAYAQRLRMSAIELGQALGVPLKLLRLHGANVALGDPALDAQQVAARACGIDPAKVGALWFGLARYDRLTADRVGARWLARVLRPMVSSRYCSSCLRESAGRWLAAWRLPWYLACPEHGTMLACGCPACGGTQRHAGLRAEHLPALMTVRSYPIAGRAGRADYRCRHDLTAQTPAAASAPGELIALQALLVAILDPTVTEVDAVALVDWLVDLLVIAARVGLDFRAIDRDRRNLASVLAGPLSQAYRALIDPHGPRLRAIAIADLAPTRGGLAERLGWGEPSPGSGAAQAPRRAPAHG
jgi:hypothetical protein